MDTVLAVLGRGVVPLDAPLLRADDLGATRGDGIFETMHVRAGRAWLVDAHLARMAGSAAALGLALPPADALSDLLATVLAARGSDDEGGVKLVCTRGPEGVPDASPTVYALAFDVADAVRRQRREGVRAVTRDLGVLATARSTAPWLLGGVKSLSYAVNMAVLREAVAHGADDAVLLSGDGQVLEGPTSTVLWAVDGALRTVPVDTGILAGTTAAHLLASAGDLGLRAEHRTAVVDDLLAADGVWLVSSVRGAARVTELDGRPLPDGGLTSAVHAVLGHPVGTPETALPLP